MIPMPINVLASVDVGCGCAGAGVLTGAAVGSDTSVSGVV